MGEVVELFEGDTLFAECPECSGTSWFVKIDKDLDYKTSVDFLLNMRSLVCTECKAEFEFEYGDLIIAEKETEDVT